MSESASGAYEIRPVARICSPYTTKFGVPRQAGLVSFEGHIVFAPQFRNPAAVRGLEGFSRIWLIWGFSHNQRESWTPTVRPPRLGGSTRQGVFATRSPFRPNGLGLSSVELLGVEERGEEGTVLRVRGMDLVDGTPIYDIKPYIPYADSFPDASSGWTAFSQWQPLEEVRIHPQITAQIPEHLRAGVDELLRQDPRPAYHREMEGDRVFWVPVEDIVIYFQVDGSVCEVLGVRRLEADEFAELRETGQIRDDGTYLRKHENLTS